MYVCMYIYMYNEIKGVAAVCGCMALNFLFKSAHTSLHLQVKHTNCEKKCRQVRALLEVQTQKPLN
jgi:hypothetical protein